MDHEIFFIESNKNTDSDQLIMISYNRPLHTRQIIHESRSKQIHSLFPQSSETLILSARTGADDNFGLYSYDLNNGKIKNTIFSDNEYHAIEPQLVENKIIPKELPSIVNLQDSTGLMICLNVHQSNLKIDDPNIVKSETKIIQILGIDKVLDEITPEKDGSFYIELDSDIPVRFQSLNEDREILRGPSSWVWLRPGERRGCVGCHENPEIAPDNRVPLAIGKPAIRISGSLNSPKTGEILAKSGKGGQHEN